MNIFTNLDIGEPKVETWEWAGVAWSWRVVRYDDEIARCQGYAEDFDTVKLEDLFVIPEYRRQGIAMQLIHYILDTLPKQFRVVRASCRPDNSPSVKLFCKLGFQEATPGNNEDIRLFFCFR